MVISVTIPASILSTIIIYVIAITIKKKYERLRQPIIQTQDNPMLELQQTDIAINQNPENSDNPKTID